MITRSWAPRLLLPALLSLGTAFFAFTNRHAIAATLIRSNQIVMSDVFNFTGNNTHSGTETFTGSLATDNLNNVRVWDGGIRYPYTAAGFAQVVADCIADSFCTLVDGRNFQATTLTSTITFSKGMKLWLGPATLTCSNSSGPCLNITSSDVEFDGFGLTAINNTNTAGQHTIVADSGSTLRRLRIAGIRFISASTSGQSVRFRNIQSSSIFQNYFDNSGTNMIDMKNALFNVVSENTFAGTSTDYPVRIESDGGSTVGSNENWIRHNTFENSGQNGCLLILDSHYNHVVDNDFNSCANSTDVAMVNLNSTLTSPVGNKFEHNIMEVGASTADFFHCNGAVGFGPIGTVYDNNQFGAGSAGRVDIRIDRCDQTQVNENRMFESSTITFVQNGTLATNTYIGPNAVPAGATYLTDTGTGTYGCVTRLCGNFTASTNFRVGSGGTIQNVTGTSTMGLTLKKGSGSGNYTTASTTYVVADSTSLCYTVTIPTGWKLSVSVSGAIGTATGAVADNVALTDNAACSTANAGILAETTSITTAAGVLNPFSLGWVITGDGASHNIALQYKTSNGADSATILNASATQIPTMVFQLEPSN